MLAARTNILGTARYKMEGDLLSKLLDIGSILKITDLSNALFIPGEMEYNAQKAVHSGTWLQIIGLPVTVTPDPGSLEYTGYDPTVSIL